MLGGVALVELATNRSSPLFAQAVKALATATALLPRICGISQDDRLRIEINVKGLRSRLDQVPVYVSVRYPALYAS